jgi:methionine sulfoxide reductase heme-binding subunit
MQKFVKPLAFLLLLSPAAWWGYVIWLAFQGDAVRLGPDPAKALALVSGEWSIRCLVLALAVTPLRYLFNWPYLWRLRRMIGLFAFFYTTLHFTVFVLLLLQLNWSDLGKELAERPYITLGFLAYVLLFLLALTSFNYAQRKLGRNWKRLHRGVYVAAVLAVMHLIWIVRSDFGEALLYGCLVLALLVYRMMHRLSPPVRKFSFR